MNDGSCFENLQAVVKKEIVSDFELLAKLNVGSAIKVSGRVEQNDNYLDFLVTTANVIGQCQNDYPLQKKQHSMEFIRSLTHLRGRTRTLSSVFKLRSVLSFGIHNFFQKKGFLYVNTPIITANDCEGGGERFRVVSEKTHDNFQNVEDEFFNRPVYLTVSGQLEAEALAHSFDYVYTFGPTFRAENSNTVKHLAEFWMLEAEMAFCDLSDIIVLAEELIKTLIDNILVKLPKEISFLCSQNDNLLEQRLIGIANTKFQIIDYNDVIDILKKRGKDFKFPVEWGMDLQTEHERFLCEMIFAAPVFVINYPKNIKSFYMKENQDNKTVAAMDLLFPTIGELIGGSQREERLEQLLLRMKNLGMEQNEYSQYLDLRRFGGVPHSGFGLGFERLVQFVTGMSNIRDVIFYPRVPGHCY